jgi:hypothetical protein
VLRSSPRIRGRRSRPGSFGAFSAGIRDYGTITAGVLEATLPGYVRSNFVDEIRNSPFNP